MANTNLFARASTGNRQLLVYSLELAAPDDVAMILPLPVPPRSAEDALRFIDLSDHPYFFMDLGSGFPSPELQRGTRAGAAAEPSVAPLGVHRVGSFEASFVPTLDDFARLDARFRLPSQIWTTLPRYADWGFAVFRLRQLAGDERTRIEPMAFEFPRRDPTRLFFPTLHIHDGEVAARARFDHNLFFQAASPTGDPIRLELEGRAFPAVESEKLAADYLPGLGFSAGIVDGAQSCRWILLEEELPNQDLFIADDGARIGARFTAARLPLPPRPDPLPPALAAFDDGLSVAQRHVAWHDITSVVADGTFAPYRFTVSDGAPFELSFAEMFEAPPFLPALLERVRPAAFSPLVRGALLTLRSSLTARVTQI